MSEHYLGYKVIWSAPGQRLSRDYSLADFELAESHWRRLTLNPLVRVAQVWKVAHLRTDRVLVFEWYQP